MKALAGRLRAALLLSWALAAGYDTLVCGCRWLLADRYGTIPDDLDELIIEHFGAHPPVG